MTRVDFESDVEVTSTRTQRLWFCSTHDWKMVPTIPGVLLAALVGFLGGFRKLSDAVVKTVPYVKRGYSG